MKRIRIALMIETAREYGRGILRGIARYARLHGSWEFYLTPGDFQQALPKMKEWEGTGIIARIQDEKTAAAIAETRLPVVALDIPGKLRETKPYSTRFCELRSDSVSAVMLAADHFLERHFTRFAFVGNHGQVWSQLRQNALENYLYTKGVSLEIYQVPVKSGKQIPWVTEQPCLEHWLQTLTKPIALLACNDQRGREVLEACQSAGINVPLEIAVMGIDNDELLCDLSNPSLTSIAMNTERGGYLAAELLDKMMSGQKTKNQVIVVEPLYVVPRRSTDVASIEDRDIAAAMQYIYNNVGQALTVDEIARQVFLSKRSLQMRFKNIFGRTISSEIREVKLNRARSLLQETDLSISEISELTGFGTTSYLIQSFRESFGMTPSKYRRFIRGN